MSYSKYWTVTTDNGEVVNLFFVTKKSAVDWIAENGNADYTITKHEM